MGLPDETSENPATQSANNLGGGTDVLYDWLVGRAAADPSLAQALATNEAQRREQIKRLAESLLAQIRELQDHQTANSGDLYSAALIDPLKLELQRVGARQSQIEAAQVNVERLEATMNAKLGEQLRAIGGAKVDRESHAAEMAAVVERLGRLEQTALLGAAELNAEIGALKIQVEHLAQMATAKSAVPLVAPNRLHTAIGATVGVGGLKPQSEALPVLKPASATEQEAGNLLQSSDTDSTGAKEGKKQLQQRISADIERVRAELRKRAGVGR